MLVNGPIIEELIQDAGNARYQKAKDYKNKGKVRIINTEYEDRNTFEVRAIVVGTKPYRTHLYIKNGEIEDISCNCEDYYTHYGVCKHTLATILEFSENEQLNEKYKKELERDNIISKKESGEYRNFNQIVNIFYNEEVDEIEDEEDIKLKNKGTIKIEPKISYDKFSGDMKVEFKIGNKKMYKIKDLSEFYTRMIEKEFYKYGEKLQFIHNREMFEEESQRLLDFIMKYAELIKYANSNANINYRYYGKALSETNIILGNTGIDELFEVLKEKYVEFQKDYNKEQVKFTEETPNIEFYIKKINDEKYTIEPNIDIYKVTIIKGKDYKYILQDNKLHRVSKAFERSNLKLLELFRQNYMSEVTFGKEELSQLFSIIIPKVKNAINVEGVPKEEIEKYKPKELGVKVFLDYDKNDYLIADVKFVYGENEFNPLDEELKVEFSRNIIEETKALNIFRKTGFMLDKKNLRFILPDDDKIYSFLTEDINYYMQKFEVLATENFKTKQIKQPKIGSVGIKVENNLLTIDLNKFDISNEEVQEVMQKYSLKKKYHRLKDGSFIELKDNNEIGFLDKIITGMDINYKEIVDGEVTLPIYRSLYLNQLLKGIKGTEIIKNAEFKDIVSKLNKEQIEEDINIPNNLEKILRYYQKIGFKWLKTLDNYKFGGILADDMGLRKNSSNAFCYC